VRPNIAPGPEYASAIRGFQVTIPQDAAAQEYPVGAATQYRGTTVRELHTHRVKVE